MCAHEIDANLTAALERHVGELDTQRLFELDRQDLIFLGRSCATHLRAIFSARAFLDCRDVLLGGFIRRVRVNPENELIERQTGKRSQIFPIKRDSSVERRRKKVRQGDNDRVRIALLSFDVKKSLCSRSAGLVYRDQRAWR